MESNTPEWLTRFARKVVLETAKYKPVPFVSVFLHRAAV